MITLYCLHKGQASVVEFDTEYMALQYHVQQFLMQRPKARLYRQPYAEWRENRWNVWRYDRAHRKPRNVRHAYLTAIYVPPAIRTLALLHPTTQE